MLDCGISVVGEELGSYRVLKPVGKGGMAAVYVGEHKVLGHRVAIKVLHPRHLDNKSIERRFFNEARSIASVRHPSVVELYDFGRTENRLAYIVMELLTGETLRARIRRGIMSERHTATFARQIAQGLSAAHAAGIVHRDLKPDNIFLVPDPEVLLEERAKVLDFGIAKKDRSKRPVSEHTATGVLVGTPAYMSPEQCRGEAQLDGRSDVYSLGVVMYRMLTNQLPFEAAATGELIGKHLYVDPKPPCELNSEISKDMNEIVLRCLAKEPNERFQSMDALADALASLPCAVLTRIGEPVPDIAKPKTFVGPPPVSARHLTTMGAATGELGEEPARAPKTWSDRLPWAVAACAVLAFCWSTFGGGSTVTDDSVAAHTNHAPQGGHNETVSPVRNAAAPSRNDAPQGGHNEIVSPVRNASAPPRNDAPRGGHNEIVSPVRNAAAPSRNDAPRGGHNEIVSPVRNELDPRGGQNSIASPEPAADPAPEPVPEPVVVAKLEKLAPSPSLADSADGANNDIDEEEKPSATRRSQRRRSGRSRRNKEKTSNASAPAFKRPSHRF